MPSYVLELVIATDQEGSPRLSSHRFAQPAGGPGFEALYALYQEAGQHERHYSTVRMAATSLLFTLAVVSVAGFYDRLTGAQTWPETLRYGAAPVGFLLLSIMVNWYYAVISARARRLEQHLENLMCLMLRGEPYAIRSPDALFFRTFERLQSRARGHLPPPAPGAGARDFAGYFENCIGQNKKLRLRVLDGPFWLVLAATAAVFLGLALPLLLSR